MNQYIAILWTDRFNLLVKYNLAVCVFLLYEKILHIEQNIALSRGNFHMV